MNNSHQCPIEGCQVQVPFFKLLCFTHWKMVPGYLGRQVYATWDDGRGQRTEAHAAACRAAIDLVNHLLQESRAEDRVP